MNDWGRVSPVAQVAILAWDSIGAQAARDAAVLAGAAPGLVVDFAAVLPPAADGNAMMVEAIGADAAALAPVLDTCADHARRGSALIISFAPSALDAVAAALLGTSAHLLCAPSVPDRAAALAVALADQAADGAGGHSRVREDGPESEAARLKRLNEEVARIAEVLARISRGEGAGRALAGSPPAAAMADDAAGATAPIAAGEVRRVIRARRLRDHYFGGGMFEDPAWDMLLDLFAAELEDARVSVSSLCIAAAVAPTTALRWIARMTEAGLLLRENDPDDRRRAFMHLSPDARGAMRRYWHAAQRLGGPML